MQNNTIYTREYGSNTCAYGGNTGKHGGNTREPVLCVLCAPCFVRCALCALYAVLCVRCVLCCALFCALYAVLCVLCASCALSLRCALCAVLCALCSVLYGSLGPVPVSNPWEGNERNERIAQTCRIHPDPQIHRIHRISRIVPMARSNKNVGNDSGESGGGGGGGGPQAPPASPDNRWDLGPCRGAGPSPCPFRQMRARPLPQVRRDRGRNAKNSPAPRNARQTACHRLARTVCTTPHPSGVFDARAAAGPQRAPPPPPSQRMREAPDEGAGEDTGRNDRRRVLHDTA
eukprot:gene22308-biopygen4216